MNYVTTRVIPTTKQVHQPAAATAAVVTVAAPGAKRRTVICLIAYSYSEAPAAGTGLLTITDGGTTIAVFSITAAGPGFVVCEIPANVNSEVVATLASGGGTSVAKLTVHSYNEPEAPNVAVS